MNNAVSYFLALVVLASASGSANAALINLTFSGTYLNFAGASVFGEFDDYIPFSYSLTYNTALNTNTEFFDAGDSIGANTALHPLYGYSASGIVATSLTIGTKTFSAEDIIARSPGAGAFADLWFDTDIALATPTLTSIFFRDAEADLSLGGGFYVNLENEMFLGAVSFIQDSNNTFHVAGAMEISRSEVPAPATFALFGLCLAGIGWSKRKGARLHQMPTSMH